MLKLGERYDDRVLAEFSHKVRQRAEATFLWVALGLKERPPKPEHCPCSTRQSQDLTQTADPCVIKAVSLAVCTLSRVEARGTHIQCPRGPILRGPV